MCFAAKLVKPSLKPHSCVGDNDHGKDLVCQSKQRRQRVRGGGGGEEGKEKIRAKVHWFDVMNDMFGVGQTIPRCEMED